MFVWKRDVLQVLDSEIWLTKPTVTEEGKAASVCEAPDCAL